MADLCPHCSEKLSLEDNNAFANIQVYGGSNVVLTKCCKNFVRVSATVTYRWHYSKTRVEGWLLKDGNLEFCDDWGNSIIKEKEPDKEITHNGRTYVLKEE